jgi:formylglycine-generating enzyme required for sulfatase activity
MKLFNLLAIDLKNKSSMLIVLLLCCSGVTFANNTAIANTRLTGQNTGSSSIKVEFDLSWDNSWRINTGASNWDACWVFVKYRKKNTTTWFHATLNYSDGTAANDGHTQPANCTITGASDGKGVFIYRSANMAQGSVSYPDIQLRWNYGTNGLASTDLVEVRVFAIEMVYVPQGAYSLGSGGAETGHFYTYNTSTSVYTVSSENAINVGATAGYLFYATATNQGDALGPIPAAFPKGYSPFYCMKYQISQNQYVDFLNTLTYTQQVDRTTAAPNAVAGTGALTNANRNGIDIQTPGVSATTPAVYACNLDADAIYNETTDGGAIACNLIGWEDIIAYLDWAALRPMTELEHEKACRGTATAVANEYAWGTTTNTSATGITNSGLETEVPSTVCTSVSASTAGVQGPMRVGCFATAATTRATSGATYYGIMDMSGNLWNYIVTAGHPTGRAFTGLNGDGLLATSGDADTGYWPLTVTGTGFRGGNWSFAIAQMRVSDRAFAANIQAGRYHSFGGRGVREP